MRSTCSFDHINNEWRIRVAEVFDVEEAKSCIQRFRGFEKGQPQRLVFDLNETRYLHTAGLGTMLFIRSCCEVDNDDAHIVYGNPEVGMMLKLANLDRWFTLMPSAAARQGEKTPWHQPRDGAAAS